MIKVFENQTFNHFFDRDSAKTFADMEFRKCRFSNCAISITRNPALRSTVRNVKLIDCEMLVACSLRTAIVEDVLIDGLKTPHPVHTWGAVFKHVTLRGKIGRVMTSPRVLISRDEPDVERAFAEANAAYYATVDWALDIREAEVQEIDIRGVSGDLIRRDPATQVLITREKAMQGKWRQLDLSGTYWPTSIQFFLEQGAPSRVLVAPKRDKKYRRMLEGLQLLREAGVTEPD